MQRTLNRLTEGGTERRMAAAVTGNGCLRLHDIDERLALSPRSPVLEGREGCPPRRARMRHIVRAA